jgi:hypothetical protein
VAHEAVGLRRRKQNICVEKDPHLRWICARPDACDA